MIHFFWLEKLATGQKCVCVLKINNNKIARLVCVECFGEMIFFFNFNISFHSHLEMMCTQGNTPEQHHPTTTIICYNVFLLNGNMFVWEWVFFCSFVGVFDIEGLPDVSGCFSV